MKIKAFQSYFPYILLVYHLAFSWFAYDYVNQNGGDAVKYWFTGYNLEKINWTQFLEPGTDAVFLITYPLVKFLQLSPLMGCLLFSAWSGIGFWRLSKLGEKIQFKKPIFNFGFILLLILPNAHFWTSLIGKEAILFPFLVFLLEKLYHKKYKDGLLWFSLFAILWVRPHLGAIIIAAFGISYLLLSAKSYQWKLKLGGILAGFFVAAYFLLEKITNAKQGLFIKISNLYAAHNEKLKATSSYVPMEDYVYPFKLFTFYFRPLPFEKSGFLYTILSIENLILLLLFVCFVFGIIQFQKQLKGNEFFWFLIGFILLFGTIFSYGYANYGLIVRTKSLLLPFVGIAWLIVFQNNQKEKILT